ncbi:MAG: NAD-dependent epimerase/dehydratase family protein [Pseudomonadota bacterium]
MKAKGPAMKVLITGGNGHLGRHLVRQLHDAGHAVRTSVRDASDPNKTRGLSDLTGIEIVSGDVRDEAAMQAAMSGIDVLIHSAAVYDISDRRRAAEIVSSSVDGASAVFAAAREAGVAHIVMTSSVVTLPLRLKTEAPANETMWNKDLGVPYIEAKTRGEQLAWAEADAHGMSLATILPGAFAGPGFDRPTPTVAFIKSIKQGAVAVAAPDMTYPYCDVRDIARAHLLAAEQRATGRFICTNTPPPTVREIAQAMAEIDPRVRKPLFTIPNSLLPMLSPLERIAMRLQGAETNVSPEMARTLSRGQFKLSTDRAKSELGWMPEISMAQSLADTMAEF